MTLYLMYAQIVLVRSKLLSGYLLEKELTARLTIWFLCIMSICNFRYFPFWF